MLKRHFDWLRLCKNDKLRNIPITYKMEAAGIEPASANPLLLGLHVYPIL